MAIRSIAKSTDFNISCNLAHDLERTGKTCTTLVKNKVEQTYMLAILHFIQF